MRSPPGVSAAAGAGCGSAPAEWTHARPGSPAPGAGIPSDLPDRRPGGLVLRQPLYGGCAGCSTSRSAGRDCAAAAGRRTHSPPATRWTSGGSKRSNRGVCSVSPRRCGCPGRAWLQFEVTPEAGGSLIRQTALFDPVGLRGLLYWYALWGIHRLVFAGMLRNIVRAAAGGDARLHKSSVVRRDSGAMKVDGVVACYPERLNGATRS